VAKIIFTFGLTMISLALYIKGKGIAKSVQK
jgi:hypothetical protein